MKKSDKGTIAVVSALVLMLGASSSLAEVYNFGSDNDGFAGFTHSATDPTESWSLEAGSARYINADAAESDGPHENGTLLKSFTLDRSVGRSYTIQGVVNLTDGYADDNNRVGIYLFGDSADVTGDPEQDETGALSLHYNLDKDRDQLRIYEGIDGTNLATEVKGTGLLDQDLFGTEVTFTADIAFVEDGGTNYIDIVGSMTDASDETVTVSVQVLADDFTGDYFGFASRGRNRGVEGRNADFTLDYRSFSVVPEPTTISLVALMGGGLLFFRRRFGL
jgi:hypothetical protein